MLIQPRNVETLTHSLTHSDISGLRIVNSLNPDVSIKNVTHAKISNFDD